MPRVKGRSDGRVSEFISQIRAAHWLRSATLWPNAQNAFASRPLCAIHNPSNPMQWYYAINGQRLGPVIESEFERLIRDGVIRPDTLVWRQGMPNWIPFAQLPPAFAPRGVPAGTVGTGTPDAAAAASDDSAICAVSGNRYPKREMIQYEGQWVSAEHRDTFFQRMREGVRAPQDFEYGGFWIRFVAKVIDRLILFAVGSALSFGLMATSLMRTQGSMNPRDPEFWRFFLLQQSVLGLVNLAIGLLFTWYFLKKFSATPGKMVFNLKVLRPDGTPLTSGRIIGRYFAEILSGMILLIGYIIAAFDEEKRALHDHICDTRVIKTR